jgi:hypothetical protein
MLRLCWPANSSERTVWGVSSCCDRTGAYVVRASHGVLVVVDVIMLVLVFCFVVRCHDVVLQTILLLWC